MGRLVAIARAARTRQPMETLDAAEVTVDAGVEGDARGVPGRRQVTVVSEEAWARACQQLGADVSWLNRRANLLVSGIPLEDSKGDRLRIGSLLLEITGETKPCKLMDEFHMGLREALVPEWRGGVICRVLASGGVQVGDDVERVAG